MFESGLPVDVIIMRDGQVVGQYGGAVGGVGVARSVGNGAPFSYPGDVRLAGCATTTLGSNPDATRSNLPPGDYQLVAVMEGGLVSPPIDIRVSC
jgi:hypothetical protein